jgi:hypothetical protein
MTKKYKISDQHILIYSILTYGLFDDFNIILCIPIHGNALNA